LEDQRREGGALRDASGGPVLPQQILVEAVDRVRQRTGREEGQGHNAGGGGSELINDRYSQTKSVQCIYGTQGIERRAVAAVANNGWNYKPSIDYCDDKPRLAVLPLPDFSVVNTTVSNPSSISIWGCTTTNSLRLLATDRRDGDLSADGGGCGYGAGRQRRPR
ncbi:hypothetical protein CT0861_03381, partial [Colletotrichum tofieldiae]